MNVRAAVSGVWREDLRAYGVDSSSVLRLVWAVLTRPGLTAVVLLRVQALLWESQRLRVLAPAIRALNSCLTGADIVSGAVFGPGLRIEHPNGIVVGHGARIGARCQLLQQVTLGERIGREGASTYPTLGDDVLVGAGARVLGNVVVGDGARIGANAVVLESIPAGRTAVGSPARVVRT